MCRELDGITHTDSCGQHLHERNLIDRYVFRVVELYILHGFLNIQLGSALALLFDRSGAASTR